MDGQDLRSIILQTVDHIVKRKTRPDCDKICHVVAKRTKVDKTEVKDELEILVKQDHLFKLIHKGIVSYRCKQSPRTIKYSLMEEAKDVENISPTPLKISKKDSEIKEEEDDDSDKMEENSKVTPKSRPVGRPRKYPKVEGVFKTSFVGKKRGRPKLHTPPSSTNPSKPISEVSLVIKTEPPPSPSPPPSCDTCSSVLNSKGQFEELLVCSECKFKAHPACLDFPPELAIKCCRLHWQCADCKSCFLCNQQGNGDKLLVCDSCDRGYHMTCHVPRVAKKPTGTWTCHGCYLEDSHGLSPALIASVQQMAYEAASGLLTPSSSPSSDEGMAADMDRVVKLYPNVVPNADNWSVEDVVKFFQAVGFPEQASAFRDQEIDGKSLLLLKRSDVLTGLDLRLGPALKIYSHVKRLQSGLPNGHLL